VSLRAGGLFVVLLAVLAGCGTQVAGGEWDASAARAIARRVQAGHPAREVRVLGTIGEPMGPELPWSVRQSLTTGGIEIAGAGAASEPGTTLLVFEHSERAQGGWRIDVRLEGLDDAGAAAALTWRVRCGADGCEAVDSVARREG
jgi:hypothetical protein